MSTRYTLPAAAGRPGDDVDVKQALTIAIEYEHKVRDHYAAGATRIADERGRRVFDTLAREERGHVDYLESRLEEWTNTGKLKVEPLGSMLPTPEWIAAAREKMATAPGQAVVNQAELDLLKTALALEHQTSGFYRSLVETLPTADRPLFERFLEIENGHLTIVQAEIDALAGHGHWFDFMEFKLEAG